MPCSMMKSASRSHAKRSAAAKKGAVTRKRLHAKRSAAAKKGAATRKRSLSSRK